MTTENEYAEIDRLKAALGAANECDEAADVLAAPVEPVAWISVKDRLPEHKQQVLAYKSKSRKYEVEWSAAVFNADEQGGEFLLESPWEYVPIDVTHWMPLPAPPIAKVEGK